MAWHGVALQGKGSIFTWRNMEWLILWFFIAIVRHGYIHAMHTAAEYVWKNTEAVWKNRENKYLIFGILFLWLRGRLPSLVQKIIDFPSSDLFHDEGFEESRKKNIDFVACSSRAFSLSTRFHHPRDFLFSFFFRFVPFVPFLIHWFFLYDEQKSYISFRDLKYQLNGYAACGVHEKNVLQSKLK